MLRAITFDFWDTLVADDSDEPVRAARGLAPKSEARRRRFRACLGAAYPALREEALDAAWEEAGRWFRREWYERQRTPALPARIAHACGLLGVAPPRGAGGLAEALGRDEVDIPPRPAPGVVDCLRALAGRYRLGIISDTVVTPASGLREILRGHGLLDFLTPEALIFSDEAGASKPSPQVFARACAALGVEPGALVHVGDREEKDVAGARSSGARAVLYTGVVDRGAGSTSADLVCADLRALPEQLAALEAGL